MGILRHRQRVRFASVALSACLLAWAASPAWAQDIAARLVVVVSNKSPVREISVAQLRSVFLGAPLEMANGKSFVPLNHAAKTPLREAFDRQILGMEPDEVGRFWVDQRIRARAKPPRTIPELATLRRVTAALPRAITYMRAADLRPGVIPVRVDGKDFRDPKYRYSAGVLHVGTTGLTRAAKAGRAADAPLPSGLQAPLVSF